MTETILECASLVVALACIASCVCQRRLTAPPHGQGSRATLQGRHATYLLCLVTLVVSCVVFLLGHLVGRLGLGSMARDIPAYVNAVLQVTLLLGLALYAWQVMVGDVGPNGGEGGGVARGRCVVAIVPLLVALCGVALQTLWEIRVATLFEAVALFGCLILFEQDAWVDRRWDDNGFQTGATLVATVLLVAAVLFNVDVARRISNEQADEIATTQLEVIGGELEDTIADAKQRLMRVAIETDEMIEAGASKEDISARYEGLYDEFKAIDTFMNVYVAGKDWYVLPHSQVSERFRPQERVWYVGALDAGGDVFISEPYLDANGSGMCLTTSVAIQGGEAVCALDLNLKKVQESVTEMTQGRDETAMIVTADGLIVGYTDMSLAGSRVDQHLPEYAEVVRRVAA